MNNPRGFLQVAMIILIIFATIVVIAAGAYWILTQQEGTNQNTNTGNINTTVNQNLNTSVNQNANSASNQNANVSSNTNSNPTADWKTYRNEKYGFEVKYPAEWESSENEEEPSITKSTKHLFSFRVQTTDEQKVASVGVFDNSENLSLGKWIDKYQRTEYGFEEVIIDGEKGRKYSITPMGQKGNQYIIPFQNKIYFLGALPTTSEFTQILESFHILKDTAGWNIYEDNQRGFYVKHPSGWNYLKFSSSVFFDPHPLKIIPNSELPIPAVKLSISVQSAEEQIKSLKDLYKFSDYNEADVFVSGRVAKSISGIVAGESYIKGRHYAQVFFKRGGDTYSISYMYKTQDFLSFFGAMISSFQFTNDNEIQNWQTYRNEKYNYEVKYPNDWLGGEDSITTDYAAFSKEAGDFMKSTLSIRIFDNEKLLPSQLWWEEYDQKDAAEYTAEVAMKIDGFTALKYKEKDGLQDIYFVFRKGSYIFLISKIGLNDGLFNKVVSSFRFIESIPKKYTNTLVGFHITYPSDYFAIGQSDDRVQIIQEKFRQVQGEFPFLSILVRDNKKRITLDNWFQENGTYYFGDQGADKEKRPAIILTKVSGKSAAITTIQGMGETRVTVVDYGDYVIDIEAHTLGSFQADDEMSWLHNFIISSLVFD